MDDHLICYKKLPIWTVDTLPSSFEEKHNTKVGTWGKVNVIKGKLNAFYLDEEGNEIKKIELQAGDHIWFEPQQWHKVSPQSQDLSFYVEFYCTQTDYFHKKYHLSAPHSEVISAIDEIKIKTILDLGCGNGRNSLFLSSRNYEIESLDFDSQKINKLNEIIEKEKIKNIKSNIYDINDANIIKQYDFIISTVVFMFLNKNKIPHIIQNMQQSTHTDGYNLIVSALSTDCPVPFPFTFRENELKRYYQGWNIIKYNENFGHLHRTDENGNPYKLRFATLLAQKKS